MKKRLSYFIIMIALLMIPFVASAKTKYATQNYKEILAEEEIEDAYPDYKESDDQVTIYLFRGRGCQYCRAFLNYLNSITEEYGKYFKVVGYEVWNDENNAKLMEKVGKFFEQEARGVPYIVIGENVFAGYADSYNDAIVSSILNEYNKEDRYDVFDEMDKLEKEERIKEFISNVLPLIVSFVSVVIATVVVIIYTNYRFNKIEKMLDEKIAFGKTNVIKEEISFKKEKNDDMLKKHNKSSNKNK